MGAIVAILGEAGDPGLAERLQRMLGRSPYRGEPQRHVEGPLAIGIQSWGWDASLHSAGNWLVAFHGYIGNWDELAPAHGLRFPSDASNAHRIAIAYEALGDAMFAKLRGEWAVLILDRHRGELLAARDVVGCRPMFRSEAAGRLYLASEIRQILCATGETARLNHDVMLDYLLRHFRTTEDTIYRGLSRLLPASVYRFSVTSSRQVRGSSHYWVPPAEPSPTGQPAPDLECELLELIDRAIDRCLPDMPFSAALSGGVDTNTIWALILDRARRGDTRSRLGRPISWVFPGFSFDESSVIRASLDGFGLDGTIVDGSQYDLAVDLDAGVEHVDGLFGGEISRDRECYRALSADGRRIYLTGDGGDEWLAGGENFVADLALSARLITFLREVNRLRPTVPGKWNLLWTHGIRPTAGALLRPIYRPDRVPPWLGKGWRRTAARRLGRPHHPTEHRKTSRARRRLLFFLDFWQGGYATEVREQLMAGSGLVPRMPLMDLDLIEFGFTTPPALFVGGNRYKNLMRKAVEGLFPEEIREMFLKPVWDDERVRAGQRTAQHENPRGWLLVELGLLDSAGIDKLLQNARLFDEVSFFRFFMLFECEHFARTLRAR